MTPAQIIAELKQIAPDISIETHWEHDHDLHDIREDCEGMDIRAGRATK